MSVVALLALDGVPAHQLSTPGLIFGAASRSFHRGPPYELRVCSATDVITAPPGAFRITPDRGLDGLEDADTVILTGYRECPAAPSSAVLDAVRAAAARGARIGAIGAGAFVLAATGLLDGRRATTDWARVPELARRHPRIRLDTVDFVVADGPFLTSAGVLGGKDLCLRIVEEEHGVPVAVEADRQLFLMLPDPSETLRASDPDEGSARRPFADSGAECHFASTTAWMEANLRHPLTLAEIAEHAGTSVRSLSRGFRARTGLTPLQYLLRARVRRAQWLLEHSDAPVAQIATRTGLGTPANLRHHFQRLNGTTPSAYRAAFRELVGIFAPVERGQVATEDGMWRG
ncbi:GlxA family transcriptional regulator [Streptomyces sp. NBC_00690]|uniref:GlxA family transcriptional regulator n=1 Tax=Streptomyces sp. NBC_00690 TaxID=2975808 RepID=UPI002E298112|nr:helix-turn-helix domain-containing protein [Streptomyces sp. NBC_00690]